MARHSRVRGALIVGVALTALLTTAQPAPAAGGGHGKHGGRHDKRQPVLISPPTPPSGRPRIPARPAPKPRTRTLTRTASTTVAAGATTVAPMAVSALAVTPPATARSFGPTGGTTSTLVLYDTTSAYGWLGELYALAAGNLATHFGRVTAEPVTSYVAGQINDHTAVVYLGSTYNEPIPAAFLNDVVASTKPVLWSGFNVWQLSGAAGSATQTAFTTKYGWDPTTSYLDTTDTMASVTYKSRALTRSTLNTGGLLGPHITNAAAVSVLGQANCTTAAGAPTACAAIAQSTGTSVPWAIRSANLTYVGEIPFSYMSESDRYLAYADLLFPALKPGATASKRAAVRLEDVNPTSDPVVLRAFADSLSSQGVPFQVGVIPRYTDPRGVFTGGTASTISLANRPLVVSALKYMQSKGGVLIQHGFTHQYSNVTNPYNAVSGDDFEFYRARCSSTPNPPYQFVTCVDTSWVRLTGALPGDSQSWAAGRVTSGRQLMTNAGLGTPTIFETPHYSATAADYRGMRQVYATRYERELLFGGSIWSGGSSANVFGQFFPYSVNDIYGGTVLPENLGNFESEAYNNNPPRTAAQVVANAAANQVVTESVASFFFHPDYPLAELNAIVGGIKQLGYTFVPAAQL